jgi:hypothetical protein
MAIRRNTATFPIREFYYITASDTLEAVNALVTDINRYLALFTVGAPVNSSTLALLPLAAIDGTKWWVTDGQKVSELPGAGTGIWVRASAGAWRTMSTDAPVALLTPPVPAGSAILTESGGAILSEDGTTKILTET